MNSPARKRILVVDDQPFVARLIEFNLARQHHEIIACRDPLEVLKLMETLMPDLFIIDVRMPGMSGTELCRQLRSLPRLRGVPIVILTALGGSAPETAARQVGADYFMTKPFSPRELAAKVEELLATHAPAADPDETAGSTGENPHGTA